MKGCEREGPTVKLPRRTFLHLAAGAVALPPIARIARAQSYPARPVRIIVGFPPGQSARHQRTLARPMAVGPAGAVVRYR
jgi:tripartite-type tricarboxylate transporter receptor subunit TctC